jgi:hypothetical protein
VTWREPLRKLSPVFGTILRPYRGSASKAAAARGLLHQGTEHLTLLLIRFPGRAFVFAGDSGYGSRASRAARCRSGVADQAGNVAFAAATA